MRQRDDYFSSVGRVLLPPARSIAYGLEIMFLRAVSITISLSRQWICQLNANPLDKSTQNLESFRDGINLLFRRANRRFRWSLYECARHGIRVLALATRSEYITPEIIFNANLPLRVSCVYVALAAGSASHGPESRRHNRHDEFSIYRIECLNCVFHFNRWDFRHNTMRIAIHACDVGYLLVHDVRQFD